MKVLITNLNVYGPLKAKLKIDVKPGSFAPPQVSMDKGDSLII